MPEYFIGVDIGTTSTKAVLYDEQLNILNMSHAGYPLLSPSPAVAEQDPEAIFRAVCTVIQNVCRKTGVREVQFVSFSSAMHSIMAVDEKGQPLTRLITWADTRAKEQAEQIKNGPDGADIYRRTGTPVHPMAPLAKIAMIRTVHPDLFNKTYKFIGIKEYVFHKLFGNFFIDYSVASATGLFNLHTLTWDEKAMAAAGITAEKLSTPVPPLYMISGMKKQYAEELTLPADTPFIIGASDGVLSNLGVSATDPRPVAITIGTSGAIRTMTGRPVTDPLGRTFCYILTENHWVIGGPVNNGGVTLRWARDELAGAETELMKQSGTDPYDALTEMAAKISPGADGLLFLPYLTGERAPLWNADAKGVFFGLGLHHKKSHLIRAVMEGVIFHLYTVMKVMEELAGTPEKIMATGGFTRSGCWVQILADLFNREVQIPENPESSCLGAVILGMKAVGKIHDITDVSRMTQLAKVYRPVKEHVNRYRELIPVFTRLANKLQDEFAEISKFQQKYGS